MNIASRLATAVIGTLTLIASTRVARADGSDAAARCRATVRAAEARADASLAGGEVLDARQLLEQARFHLTQGREGTGDATSARADEACAPRDATHHALRELEGSYHRRERKLEAAESKRHLKFLRSEWLAATDPAQARLSLRFTDLVAQREIVKVRDGGAWQDGPSAATPQPPAPPVPVAAQPPPVPQPPAQPQPTPAAPPPAAAPPPPAQASPATPPPTASWPWMPPSDAHPPSGGIPAQCTDTAGPLGAVTVREDARGQIYLNGATPLRAMCVHSAGSGDFGCLWYDGKDSRGRNLVTLSGRTFSGRVGVIGPSFTCVGR